MKPATRNPQPVTRINPQQPTFMQLWRHMINVLKWRFSPKMWIGKRFYIIGKMRTVTAETYDHVFVEGLRGPIRKTSRYFNAENLKR